MCERDDISKDDKQVRFGKCFEGRTKRIFWQTRCMVRDEENSKTYPRILCKQLMLLSTEMGNNMTETNFVKSLFVQQTKIYNKNLKEINDIYLYLCLSSELNYKKTDTGSR